MEQRAMDDGQALLSEFFDRDSRALSAQFYRARWKITNFVNILIIRAYIIALK